MRRIATNAVPTKVVFVFVIVVLFLQLSYLVLVRPSTADPTLAAGKKIIGYDHVLRYSSYKPIKLHNLLDHRKDHTNSITVVFLELAGLKLAQNFLLECTKFKISNYIIFSLDNYTTCEKLADENCYFEELYNFTTEKNRMTYKINVTAYLVQEGYNVFSAHKDILLSDNPLLYFDRTVDINVLQEYPTSEAKAKSDPKKCCSGDTRYYDAGFFFVRSTQASAEFLGHYWKTFVTTEVSMGEAFNTAIAKSPDLMIKPLSNIQFPNGFIAFWMAQAIDPVAIHSNWAGLDTKIYRARELMHWNLDEAERYSAPRKYITYSAEDDVVTLQIEKDHLLLAYMLAKLLDRNLILPKFHCYIDKPASCLLDAIFDPKLTLELDVYENAFLTSPLVPQEHLRRSRLTFPDMDASLKIGSMKDLMFQLQGFEGVPLLDIQFPKIARDGKHYSLGSISDRRAKWNHELYVTQVEKSVQFSNEILGNWTNFLPDFISGDGADFVCVVTVAEEMDFLAANLQRLKIEKPIYIISDDPARPNPHYMYHIKENLKNKVVFGYDELWHGYKLMEGHSVLAHIQMETCIRATDVVVNTFVPIWLVGGICSTRRNIKKSACIKLLKNPWEISDVPKIESSSQPVQTPKEKQERSKIERFHHGVLAVYPERGPTGGGNLVTFLHSPENASVSFSNDNYGGCTFGGTSVSIAGVTKYMDAFYLVQCYAPAHAEGEVDPILVVDGEERIPFPGTITYKYMTQDAINSLPDPYLAICTVFKNQALFLREWIVFHHMLGVNKFYLYDQGSEEDWKSTVADYIEKGIIEYYQWDLFLKPSTRMQTAALWHCMQNHHEISWMAMTDIDEYLFPVQKGKDRNLTTILKEFDKTNIAQVYVDRVNYGPSGHDDRPKGLVTENYYWREPFTYSPVKSLVKPKFVIDTICGGVHTFKLQEGKMSTDVTGSGRSEECGRTMEPALQRLRVNHYWSKSVEDFNQKLSWDGNPYQVAADELLQKWTNAVEDRILEPYLFDLKKKMKQKV